MRLRLAVNGRPWEGEVEPRLTLADLLRDRLRLTGTHLGCEHGVCGACTVLLDGEATRSCLTLAAQADGAAVTTVEGLARGGLQWEFAARGALQCGFCTPGFLVSATALLGDRRPRSREEIGEALSGLICRCTGYEGIVDAVYACQVDPPPTPTLPRKGGGRIERHLAGRGAFLADLPHDGALEVAFVRSPFAHARIGAIAGARATAADLGLRDVAVEGPGLRARPWAALARERARFAGEPVAVVWAEDRRRAEDLADEVAVEWEPLEPEPPEVLFEHELRAGPLEEAMAAAAHVFERELRAARQAPLPLEGRGVAAAWDAGAGRLTVHTSTQVPHVVRRGLALALDLDEAAIRVVVPDVGGGFGLKAHLFAEEIVVAALARRLARPVRWVEDRLENLLAGVHAHDNVVRLRVGVDPDGRVLAVDAEVDSDVGAHSVYPFSASLEPVTAGAALFAAYAPRALRVRVRALSSHRCPVGASRGVGTTTAVFATERMLDVVAAELGLDPLELRRRNALTGLPCTTLSGRALDSGDYAALLDRLDAAAGYAALRAEQAAARSAGRLVGVGVALFNEHSGTGAAEYRARGLSEVSGLDACRVRVLRGGRVEVSASSVEIGQGLAETCRRVAARELGVDPGLVDVVMGDTDRCPEGTGAFVSRGAVGLLDSVVAACRAVAERDLEPGTDVVRVVDPRQVFASGAHLAVVEVDPVSWVPRVLRYVAVEDCGTVVDQAAVDGQLRGGVAMGIGEALLEECVYGPDGQPRSATLLDYLVPGAADVPAIELSHLVSPSPRTALGSKGVGEAGTIGAVGAVANAVADAVAPLGAELTDLPCSPNRLFEAAREGKRKRRPGGSQGGAAKEGGSRSDASGLFRPS
jgi:aerobic carbon-monoxide dehydrogenase large subunit